MSRWIAILRVIAVCGIISTLTLLYGIFIQKTTQTNAIRAHGVLGQKIYQGIMLFSHQQKKTPIGGE